MVLVKGYNLGYILGDILGAFQDVCEMKLDEVGDDFGEVSYECRLVESCSEVMRLCLSWMGFRGCFERSV